MKTKLIFCLFLVLYVSHACKDKIYNKFLANSPIYMDYTSFRNSIGFEQPRAIKDKGSIYAKDGFLFIIENGKGIHFINNSNPSIPQKIGFLNVIGCTGMAMKGNYLFVNNLIDLVVIDVSTLTSPVVIKRMENIFPDVLPTPDPNYPLAIIEKEKGVVVAWEIKQVKQEALNNNQNMNSGEFTTFDAGSGNSFSSSTGTAGSITKFTIIHEHLYVMEGHTLFSIGISNPYNPTLGQEVRIWRVVETLFPHDNYIFMGTTSGMLIYSTVNPNEPTYLAEVNHLTACDPVVVKGNYAYVTIREGRNCGGTINQLDIIDISTINNPILKKSYNMFNPYGLGIENNLLFICDGNEGLKIYDATIPEQAGDHLLKQFSSIKAIDVIPQNSKLILIAEEGLYQYDYSDPQNIVLLSTILFN